MTYVQISFVITNVSGINYGIKRHLKITYNKTLKTKGTAELQ